MPGNGFAAHREVALAPQVMAFLLSRVGQPLFGWSIREISIVRVISRVWLGKLVACRSFCCLTPVKWLVTGQSLSNSDSSEEEKRVGLLRLKLDINWLCKRKRKNRATSWPWKWVEARNSDPSQTTQATEPVEVTLYGLCLLECG